MKRIFLIPILILLAITFASAQDKTAKKPKSDNSNNSIELSLSDNLLTTLMKLENGEDIEFNYESFSTDTPGKDSIKTVVIKTIESDSGDIVEVIIKDKNGKITRTLHIEEDLWDDFDFDTKDFAFKGNKLKVKPRRKKKNKNIETDWLSLDIGFNSLLHNGATSLPTGLSNLELDPLKSLHVNVLVFQQKVNLYRHYVGLVYGINYDNNDYRFNNDIDFRVTDGGDSLSFNKVDTEGFDRNKLTTRFLSVPLALRFDFNPKKRRGGHITVGAHAGYRLTSFFKKVSFEDGDKRKTKVKDDYLLNNIRYGAFVRVGYGRVNVFGSYVFTPLFRGNTTPEFNTFSFGLSFGGF